MKKYKKDIIILSVLFILAFGLFFLSNIMNHEKSKYVKVYREDVLIKTYPLNENAQYEIKTENDSNQIVIQNRSVFMKDANCPDKLCVKQGKVSKNGESIICLPHKIVVKISSEEEAENE